MARFYPPDYDDDCALVRCAGCGEFFMVPYELLGNVSPSDVVDYLCGECDPDEFGRGEWYEDAEQRDAERNLLEDAARRFEVND